MSQRDEFCYRSGVGGRGVRLVMLRGIVNDHGKAKPRSGTEGMVRVGLEQVVREGEAEARAKVFCRA